MSTPSLRQRPTSTSAPTPGQAQKDLLMAQATAAQSAEEADLRSKGQTFTPPTFTIKQLLDAIPAHCYQRSAVKSSQYIVQDFIAIGLLVWASFETDGFVGSLNLPKPAYHIARAIIHTSISIWMGLFGTGLWIIAHEAGHQAFSTSKSINNFAGWVLHSILLVPYHSWRISHGRHHAATGHVTRDEVFVPKTRKEIGAPEVKEENELDGLSISEQRQEELKEAIGDAPIFVLGHLLIQQLFGWPAYLIRNASGQRRYPKFTNHFDPRSIIFKPEHFSQILISDLGLLIVLSAVGYWMSVRGFREVLVLYILPYLQVNHWLVAITFAQHTDPLLPHYSAEQWTFAKGALCTFDRKFFGPIGKHVLHGICETHVAHHISSKIPHYNAWEATEAIKNYVGEYYMYTDENFLVSVFNNYRQCRFIEDTGDVLFYKNGRGQAARAVGPADHSPSDSGVDVSADKN